MLNTPTRGVGYKHQYPYREDGQDKIKGSDTILGVVAIKGGSLTAFTLELTDYIKCLPGLYPRHVVPNYVISELSLRVLDFFPRLAMLHTVCLGTGLCIQSMPATLPVSATWEEI